MQPSEDIQLTCRQCGNEFTFTKAEQDFYQRQGFIPPRRCRECRATKHIQAQPLVCSQCNNEIEKGAAAYCTACLASAHLEAELDTSKIKKASNEAHTKLMVSESQRAELAESLRQKESLIFELEQKAEVLNQDLEKAYQFHTVIGTLQPVLHDLEERLKSVEYTQNKINERMLQMVEKMHEMYDSSNLLDMVKRSLGQYRRQGT